MNRLLLTLIPALALWITLGLLPGCPANDDDDDDNDSADDDVADDDAADDDAADDDAADDDTADDDAADDDTGDDDDSTPAEDSCEAAGGVTLVFETPGPISTCEAPWMEADVELYLRDSSVCSGCSGDVDSGTAWVYPAELYLDFAGLDCVVYKVVAEVIADVAVGAAVVSLYDAGGAVLAQGSNTTVGNTEMVGAGHSGGTPSAAAGLDGCETAITLVQLL